jgi:hypothetical protein
VRAPVLGAVACAEGYGCARCGSHGDANVLANAVHDLRCWGARTALYNLRIRLWPPDWFLEGETR